MKINWLVSIWWGTLAVNGLMIQTYPLVQVSIFDETLKNSVVEWLTHVSPLTFISSETTAGILWLISATLPAASGTERTLSLDSVERSCDIFLKCRWRFEPYAFAFPHLASVYYLVPSWKNKYKDTSILKVS